MLAVVPRENKVSRHRARLRAAGLRPVQFWVQDTRANSYATRLRKQCQALNNGSDEADVLKFSEAAASLVQGWQ